MADQPQSEVTLLRKRGASSSSNGAADESVDGSPRHAGVQRTVRRSHASKDSKSDKGTKKQVNPDERLRQVISILLWLGGVLLLLALVSYTPLDQANAEVRFGDIFGLFTNDPAIAARADTTQNWLGLLGAFLANFLINSTVGYWTIVIPALVGLWGGAIFVGKGYEKLTRISLYTLLIITLVASIFGTVQLVSWMPHPAHEWSGVIGAFIASILTGLIGSAGSFLLLAAALLIASVYATNSDLRKVFAFLKGYFEKLREQAAHSKSMMSAKLGETSTTESQDGSNGVNVQRAADEAADNEPARMVRRMRPIDEEPARQTAAAPKENQKESLKESLKENRPATPAARAARDIPFPEPQIARPVVQAPKESAPVAQAPKPVEEPEPEPLAPYTRRHPAPTLPSPTAADPSIDDDPLLTDAARAAIREEQARAARKDDPVKIVHGAPAPPQPLPSAKVNRLTLNVQEGETDADLETEDEGELIERLKDEQIKYTPPSIDLLVPQSEEADVNDDELKENGRILQEKLGTFNIQIENLTVTPGPVVTLYEFVPAAGIKIAQIESLTDDIALAMKARGIRIIAPIPGKGTVGVEIPNHKPAMVRIRSVLNTTRFREAAFRLPLALGKTTVGEVFCDDLAKMPHLLIAGATGSGKSVGVNAILASLLYKMHPSDLKFVIIDPKKIELSLYKSLRNHFLARCPDIDEEIITNPQNAVMALKSLEMEMDRRYDILAKVGQRNIFDYNTKVEEGRYKDVEDFHHVKLPYIVLILDELADLMITAAKEVEEPIARLAQLARAIGIHMIVATQRPSVDVITGVIKANFPARIAYQVASKIDSRTILDMNGAEQLLGNGDMLFLPGGFPKPIRLQNAFISTEEVEQICEHIGKQRGYTYPYMLPSVVDKNKKGTASGGDERDELFDEAARLVVRHQQGSVSLIQRRLKVGYSRAARIVDELEMAGIVGPFDGSKARAVLLESEAELEAYL